MQALRDEQPQQPTETKNPLPIYIGAVIVVILIAVVGWFGLSDVEEPKQPTNTVSLPEPVVGEPEIPEFSYQEPVVEEQPATDEQSANPVDFSETEAIEDTPPPLDLSDTVIAQEILSLTPVSALADLLIDQDIIRRFVIFTDNIANQQIAKNHHLLKAPTEDFSVSENQGIVKASAASYKRYDIYTSAFIAMNVNGSLDLFDKYQTVIQQVYAEIGYPDIDFSDTLIQAINHMLATPENVADLSLVQPAVVYTYADSRVEALSDVQKQLLRMGDTNLKQIKNKLRAFKRAIEVRQ